MLSNDPGRFNIAQVLFNNYIIKTVLYIVDGNYEEAVSTYSEMTKKLIAFYKIDDTITVDVGEVEPTKSGHGYLVKRTNMA